MSFPCPPCMNCVHFDFEDGSCPAYDEIPQDIMEWRDLHHEVRPDQQGDYVYTPIEEPWEYPQRFFPETLEHEKV